MAREERSYGRTMKGVPTVMGFHGAGVFGGRGEDVRIKLTGLVVEEGWC